MDPRYNYTKPTSGFRSKKNSVFTVNILRAQSFERMFDAKQISDDYAWQFLRNT